MSFSVADSRLSGGRLAAAGRVGPDEGPKDSLDSAMPEPVSHLPARATPARKSPMYLAVVVVVAVLVIAGVLVVFVAPHLEHHPSSNGLILVAAGHSYDVFAAQDADVSFTLNATTTLSGAFTTTYGITVFVLDTVQYGAYVHTGHVNSSQWASGEVSSGTISDQLPAGSWNLAFIDTNVQATSVYISSPITLTPG
ncbi:MAG: hypothetical protein L3K00_06660 [Thermoplasmata archaeon]|nr:hypothetical protein [Thermoplasmata archaeon]